MPRAKPIFLAHTQPGFEAIAAREIATELEDIEVRGTRSIADKNGMVLFSYPGDPRDLLELRTVEDVFVVVLNRSDLPPTYAALRELRDAAGRAPVDEALQIARQLQPGRGGQGKLRFRVVARQANQAPYRRVDAQQAVERGLAARTDHRWRLEEEGALEFWLTMLPDETLLALRITDARMRQHEEKRKHLPASLRPTAAAAMVWLTRPILDDVFLDPMCGAGTLLIERAHAGRYAKLVGGDISEQAVAAALANIGTRYQPIEVSQWDARQLPLDAGSVHAAAVNLPFGKQVGTPEENRGLYPAFLREAARVLRPGARLVTVTADVRSLDQALVRTGSALTRRESYPVMLLGQRARVDVIERA